MLIPEPENPHDANAVRVEIKGRKVGYLSRVEAAHYRSLLGLGQAPVAALIIGGWDRGDGDTGSYGMRLASTMKARPTRRAPPILHRCRRWPRQQRSWAVWRHETTQPSPSTSWVKCGTSMPSKGSAAHGCRTARS